MARPKAFDPATALDRAVEVFWRQGYEGTSVQDLVDAMGINRASLYDTFGDKQSLWLMALDRYAERSNEVLVERLRAPGDPVSILRETLLQSALEAREGSRVGCFLTNSGVEKALDCDATKERVKHGLCRIEGALAELVRRGEDQGGIRPGDAQARGRFLLTVLQGLVVLARAGGSQERLEQSVDVALEGLKT